jgi:carbamoyl-phosphate synthase large subunit
MKPDNMYGSQGTRLVKTASEFLSFPPSPNDVICEYLPGPEYSIDCFSDRHGKLLFVGPRSRERVRMGTSMHSEIPCGEIKQELSTIALKINNAISMRGAWFFQVKADITGKFKLLEIESRIAGTMALNRVLGVNFPLLSVYDHFEIDVRVSFVETPVIIDRSLTNRYLHNIDYDTVYIDLDDTIIIKNKINLQVIHFIFQCINSKKSIVLLTKSTTENLYEFLNSWKIYKLFDEIILLDENDLKSNYIKDKNSIFIDDSYSQRMEVSRKHGILTFDPSMVEVLIDERC